MVAVLEQFITGWMANSESKAGPPVSKKNIFDELSEIDPETAAEFIPLLQSAIRKAKELENARPIRSFSADTKTSTGIATRKTKSG